MYGELSFLVKEQGVAIDNIESNIRMTSDAVKGAEVELKEAERHQKDTCVLC
jgi:hypothetical protein